MNWFKRKFALLMAGSLALPPSERKRRPQILIQPWLIPRSSIRPLKTGGFRSRCLFQFLIIISICTNIIFIGETYAIIMTLYL